jgi:HSP20 family protein
MAGTLTSGATPSEVGRARTRLDCLYEEWLSGGTPGWTTAIDIVRTDGSLVVLADLPGVTPEALMIDVEDGILTISGNPEVPMDRTDARYVRRERRAGSFCRSVALPAGVDAEQVTATTHDGVVEVTIPLPAGTSQENSGRRSR